MWGSVAQVHTWCLVLFEILIFLFFSWSFLAFICIIKSVALKYYLFWSLGFWCLLKFPHLGECLTHLPCSRPCYKSKCKSTLKGIETCGEVLKESFQPVSQNIGENSAQGLVLSECDGHRSPHFLLRSTQLKGSAWVYRNHGMANSSSPKP